ncbi:MAG: ShlB/FhaC/HecB family hemolysin secretion/activation protein [Kiritimatiellia bacterium]
MTLRQPKSPETHTVTDDAFEAARAGAEATYLYGNLDLSRETRLPRGFSCTLQIEGQIASTNLLGSEAVSGGGFYSVRGYEEGEVIGDNGGVLRQELRLPALQPASNWFGAETPDSLSLYAFQDAAYLWNTDELEGEEPFELASLGLGLDYQFGRVLTLQLAYGWQLTATGRGNDDSRLHLALTAGF